MSKNNSPDMSQLLSRVPNVDSPRELDQVILAESRRLVPERPGIFSRGWIPVTATVCMISLAVFMAKPILFNIGQPQRSTPSPALQKQKSDANIESFNNDQAVMDSESSSNQAAEQAMETEARAPSADTAIQETGLDAGSGDSQEVKMRLETVPKKLSAEKKESQSDPDSSIGAARPASTPTTQDELSRGNAANELIMLEPVENDQKLSKEKLNEILQEIRTLVEAGNLDAAKSRLEKLKKQCPGCGVPESLDEF